jgi:hypothetical protein
MDEKTIKRFFDKIEKTETCWNWTAYKVPAGYGQFRNHNGECVFAHRYSALIHGKLKEQDFFCSDRINNICVCHTCDNPSCVNPQHLFVGTKGDNNKDRSKKGRTRNKHI